ncbi:MAG TPA: EamA family transporter [Pseudomonas sp.]|uniref:DMT family transporter n=1 Tax=Pseudomonas sp. TaxID=306 RepID=UPI002CC46393|nr:EamA family transporter [Pseudomonas sp.]HTO18767.1 EamA family transporter [Pseudomonas sp.]
MPTRHLWAASGLLLSSLLWAGNALIGRAIAGEIPPLTLSFWRWLVALCILLPFVAGTLWQYRATLRQAGWRLPVIAALGIGAYNSLLYTAAKSTTAINITLLNTCIPLATFLFAGLLLKEWPKRRAWLGMGIAVAGLLVLISQASLANLLGLSFNPGDLVMILAVLAWALYTVLLRLWAPWLPLPPLALLGAFVLIGVPVILPFYLLEFSQLGGFELNARTLGAILYTAIPASLIAYLTWNQGVKILGAAKASLALYTMPVFAAVLAYLLLGETLQTFHWVGGALIFGGLLFATRPGR